VLERGRRALPNHPYLRNGVAARALIFIAPSVASIVITDAQMSTNLSPLWWTNVAAVAIFVSFGLGLVLGPWVKRGAK
jgi:hypothetical protein